MGHTCGTWAQKYCSSAAGKYGRACHCVLLVRFQMHFLQPNLCIVCLGASLIAHSLLSLLRSTSPKKRTMKKKITKSNLHYLYTQWKWSNASGQALNKTCVLPPPTAPARSHQLYRATLQLLESSPFIRVLFNGFFPTLFLLGEWGVKVGDRGCLRSLLWNFR